jgi:hypothetical protein
LLITNLSKSTTPSIQQPSEVQHTLVENVKKSKINPPYCTVV